MYWCINIYPDFANNLSANKKLFKIQLSKVVKLGGFFPVLGLMIPGVLKTGAEIF